MAYVNPQGRGRRLCLLFALGALVAAALLAGPNRARADAGYVAIQCYPAAGGQDHSAATFSGSGRVAKSAACADRGLGLAAPGRARRGSGGGWELAAPKGTHFLRIGLQSRERAAKGWQPKIVATGSGGQLFPILGLAADGAWHDGGLAGSFDTLDARLSCAGGHRGRTAGKHRARRLCRHSRRPFVYARQFQFTLLDSAPPQIGNRSGSLLAGGTRSGPQSLTVSASDHGGGISQLFLRVNGIATAVQNLGCNTTQMGADVVGATLSPCPNQHTETFATNASALPFKPGANAVQVCARDYSTAGAPGSGANTTCSATQTVTANGGCDKVASSTGSDGNSGSPDSPYGSAQRLADSLSQGQTGCLRTGTYAGGVSVSTPGVTLTSYPGERATISGKTYLTKDGDRVTISRLNLLSGPGTGEFVNGSNDVFDADDVTSRNTENCFIVGSNDPGYGRAVGLIIENSRIHNCGQLNPDTNMDHGIYVAYADGTIIRNNYIYDNADRGIQLYPDALLTHVYGNVIDGNGQGVLLAGDGLTASSGNFVEDNVITNSRLGENIDSRWPGGKVGVYNLVRNNCVWTTSTNPIYRSGGGITSVAPLGFGLGGNVVGDPRYASRLFKDFTLGAGSPCAFTGA